MMKKGKARYLIIERLRIGLCYRALNFSALKFVDNHFLSSRPLPKRCIWGLYLVLIYFFKPGFRFLVKEIDASGEIVFFGNSNIEYFLSSDEPFVRKSYSGTLPNYVERSMCIVKDLPSLDVRTDGQSVCMPFYQGRPVEALHFDLQRSTMVRAILEWRCLTIDSLVSVEFERYVNKLNLDLAKEGFFFKHQKVQRLFKSLESVPKNLVLAASHGDMKPENVILEHDNVHMIDLELVDIRSSSHDFFNLILHDLIHRISICSPQILNKRLKDLRKEALGLLTGVDLKQFSCSSWVYLDLAMLEKLALYICSGRWDDCRETAFRDWLLAMDMIDLAKMQYGVGRESGS